MAKKQEHPNLAKNKKIKFSATMPEHQESEEVGSQDEDIESESREESFSGNDSSEDEMDVSGSEENSEDSKGESEEDSKEEGSRKEESKGKKDQRREEEKKIAIKSGGNKDKGQEQQQQQDCGSQSSEDKSSSGSGQQQSSYQSSGQQSQQTPHRNAGPQTFPQPQPTQAPLPSTTISQNPHPTLQQSRVASSQQSSSQQSVPQQQVQTDDFDSEVVNGEEVVNQGQLPESRIQEETATKDKPEGDANVAVITQDKQEVDMPMQMEVQNPQVDLTKARVKSQEGSSNQGQAPQPIVQQQAQQPTPSPPKQNKKPKKPSSKKPTPLTVSPVQPIATLQQQQKIQEQPANDNESTVSSQDQDSFYEYIHPYLMLIGSEIVETYMSKKLQYKPSEASTWATELSSQVLLTTYFDGVAEPQAIDEEQDQQKKEKLMQKAILQHQFYRSLHSQMQALYKQQAIPKLSLGKLYFMIKRYKTIASCIMVERKPNKQYSMNVSSSGFWNRRKDGQINFTYENKNIYVFLTLYGVERDRDAGDV